MVHLFQPNVPIAIQEVIIIFVSEVCYGDNRKGQVLGGGRKEHGKTPIKTHLNNETRAGVSNLISFGSYFLKIKVAERNSCYTILRSHKLCHNSQMIN